MRRMSPQTIEVSISDWEIECCAPPPVVGALSTWWLEFVVGDDALAHEDTWTVTHQDRAVLLERNGIHAAWSDPVGPPPPGAHRLRGSLTGTVHGGTIPEGLPAVTGRVERIRLVSHEIARDPAEPRALHYVATSRSLRDVRESPRRFHLGPVGPGRQDTGLVVDLAVRPR
jgi:hypothetical protein